MNTNSLNTDSSRGLTGAYSGFELRGREKTSARFDGVLGEGAASPSGVAYGNDRYLLAQSTKFGTHIL